MDLLMNGLLMAASLFAGGYCWVLGRRVQDLKSLDRGLGGSIVTLTRQIELARLTLEEAKSGSKETKAELAQLVTKADAAANQLRMLIAAAPVYQPAAPAAAPPAATPAPTYSPAAAPAPTSAQAPAAPAPVVAAPASEPAAPVEAAREEAAGPARAMNLAEVPKPRALAPIENPLRRAKGRHAPGPTGGTGNEEEILEALTALAAGGQ